MEPCGVALNAQFVETHYATSSEGVQFVRTDKVPTEDGLEFVSAAKGLEVLLLGSAIAVEAYGFPVVGCIPYTGDCWTGTPRPTAVCSRSDSIRTTVSGLNEPTV